jgi:hypothetical protein
MVFKQHPFVRAIALFIKSWIIALSVLIILYFAWLREWQMNWGATEEDINRYMSGDELIQSPEFNSTRAVKIKASPEQMWPWIVQMGYKRAGLYGFDNLDNGGIPSADRIIPEFQNLKVGDFILPPLKVVEIDSNKSMLWVFQKGAGGWQNATWSWGLYKIDDEHTRLVSRLRQKYTFNSVQEIVMWAFVDVIEIFMMRTTLLGIKHRLEHHQKSNYFGFKAYNNSVKVESSIQW